MSHFCDLLALDAKLDNIADNADKMFLCSSQPSSYAEASATYRLAVSTLTKGDGNGDYTKQNGAPGNSRRLVVAEQASVGIDNPGNYRYLVLADSVNSRIKYIVDQGVNLAVLAGATIDVPEFRITDIQPITEV